MGLGYQVEVNRRYGGHDGVTEWEIRTRTAVPPNRVEKLQELNHPLLCAFHFNQAENSGGSNGFCVREGASWDFVGLLCAYLTAWPGEDAEEAFQRIADRTIPKETT